MLINYLAYLTKMDGFVVLASRTTVKPSTDTGQPSNDHRHLILWNLSRLQHVLFIQFLTFSVPESLESTTDDLQEVTSCLLTDSTLNVAFPNLATLVSLHLVLSITTATVERSFSGKITQDQAMRVCIEGPPTLI